MNIIFRTLENNDNEFKQIHKWCENKFVYEWFEQRVLSMDEIFKKYRNKLERDIQKLFIIQYKGKDTLGNLEVISVLLNIKNTNNS